MELFKVSCLLASLVKLGKDILERNTKLHHHNCEMIDKVSNFINSFAVVIVLCRNDCFTALLSYFFKNLVNSFIKKVTSV